MSGSIENQTILTELHYCGSIGYFALLQGAGQILIDQNEHYSKGSYRNRCIIAGANGKLRLTVPLAKGKNDGMAIRDVRIYNKEPWQKNHWRSIASAYGKSPFFQHYAHLLSPHFEKRYAFLFDLDLEILHTFCKIIGIDSSVTFTAAYLPFPAPGLLDYRNKLIPKSNDGFPGKAIGYAQVFSNRHGFLENLSVLDLICCKGPESIMFLQKQRKLMDL